MDTEEDVYIPGVCNIGKREVNRRRNSFILAAVVTVAWATALFALGAPKVARLSLFIPTMALGVTFQQWYFKFCIAYAYWGYFNFKEVIKPSRVKNDEFRKKDMEKVRGILIASFIYAVIITATAYYVK